MLLNGHQYYLIAYDYDTNCIFAIPIKDVTGDSIIEAFNQVFTELKEEGLKPTFNVMDDQSTTPSKNTSRRKDVDGSLWSQQTTV